MKYHQVRPRSGRGNQPRMSQKPTIDAYRGHLASDFEFFCAEEVRIKGVSGQIVPFLWNRPQRRVALMMLADWKAGKPLQFIILKARQWGCSTLVAAFYVWIMCYTANYSILVLWQDATLLPKVREMYKRMHSSVRAQYVPTVAIDNDEEFKLSNGSGVNFQTAGTPQTASKVGRGATYQLEHLSEVPMWSSPDATMVSCKQCVHLGPRTGLILEATPLGASGYFYDAYQNAKTGNSDYRAVFVPWFEIEAYCHPTTPYQEDQFARWRAGDDECRQNLQLLLDDEDRIGRFGLSCGQWMWWCYTLRNKFEGRVEKMRQEFADDDVSCFLESGGPVFTSDVLAYLVPLLADVPRFTLSQRHTGQVDRVPDPFGLVHIREEPVPGASYLVSGDTAETGGATNDFQSAHVWRRSVDGLHLCAKIHAQIEPDEFAEVLMLVWRMWFHPIMAIEANLPFVNAELRRLGCTTLYRRVTVLQLQTTDGQTLIQNNLGWYTDRNSRSRMLSTARRMLRQKQVFSWDRNLYAELGTFVVNTKTKKMEADKGKHDDAVMDFSIACEVHTQMPLEASQGDVQPAPEREDIQKVLRDQMDSRQDSAGKIGLLARLYAR